MEFEQMTAAQYRALSDEELETRRKFVVDLCDSDDCDVDSAVLRDEANLIADEIIRRNAKASIRDMHVQQVAEGAGVVVTGQQAVAHRSAAEEEDDPTTTIEYRTAFMGYVMNGTRSDILVQTRGDASTTTSDIGILIPTNLVNRILEKAESVGYILPLVTKTSFPVGQTIPKGSLKPTATWVAEGASSDRQKVPLSGSIVFSAYKLRCEVSISQEVSVQALSVFENKLVDAVAKAMTRAKEAAIINGSGTGKPTGILKETPEEGQAIELASGTDVSYGLLVQAEAALPPEYETGAKWCMHKKSFMAFMGMVDDNGQPIARVNVGVGGRLERTLLGREVVICNEYMPAFNKAPDEDTTWAFIFDFEDYVLNSNYNLGIQRKQDWDTEDWLTKAVEACDGKVIDNGSLVTITSKKAAA